MEQEKYAKNGQLVEAVKTLAEMTKEEQRAIRPIDEGKFDTYHVQYNKAGELLHVSGYGLMKDVANSEVDQMDGLQLLFASKYSKAYQGAKKRLNVTNEEVNKARALFNKEV